MSAAGPQRVVVVEKESRKEISSLKILRYLLKIGKVKKIIPIYYSFEKNISVSNRSPTVC